MIPPRQQWLIEIDVTNACTRKCSNCTRMLAHARKPFFMPVDTFEQAVDALVNFPDESEPDSLGRTHLGDKQIGCMGGEPRLHPEFDTLCEIFRDKIPNKGSRTLWTGLPVDGARDEAVIRETFGHANHNPHDPPSRHAPALVAIQDVVEDEQEMWRLIDQCWIQQTWSATITPKGFFFCEVAGALDMIFDGPGGLPMTDACWRHDLADYRDQIERWCPRCGFALWDRTANRMAVPGLRHRMDNDGMDDISRSNVEELRRLGSPAVLAGNYAQYVVPEGEECESRTPWRYTAQDQD